MIELYKFGPAFGLRETGPFVLKLMAYMRLAGIPYSEHKQTDTRKGPKKKVPYIVDEGEAIGDSTFIIKHLKRKFGDPLAEGLSPQQLATGHALKVMLEERTYWAGMLYPRWVKPDHHRMLADKLLGDVPKFLRMRVFGMIVKNLKKAADGHGIGRHSDAEIFELGVDDIKTLEAVLGDQEFMLGGKAAEVDATVYAFLYGFMAEIFPTPIQTYIRGSASLMAYIDRMDKLVFAEDAAQ